MVIALRAMRKNKANKLVLKMIIGVHTMMHKFYGDRH